MLMFVLLGAVVYDQGYLRVQSELVDREEALAVKTKILAKYMALIADRPQRRRGSPPWWKPAWPRNPRSSRGDPLRCRRYPPGCRQGDDHGPGGEHIQ